MSESEQTKSGETEETSEKKAGAEPDTKIDDLPKRELTEEELDEAAGGARPLAPYGGPKPSPPPAPKPSGFFWP